jgi:hypothetical protein
MISTHRDFLKASALAAGAAVPLELNGLPFLPPLPRTLPSRAPLPPKFVADLPLLPVLNRRDLLANRKRRGVREPD